MAKQYTAEEMTHVKAGSGNKPKVSDKTKSGSGGKGGGRPDVNPETSKGQSAIAKSRAKKSGFGYYDNKGKYVPAYIDAFDGGGMNQQGTYFAGGPLSNILNVMKVAPKGSGDVPRERIGYRDLTDMFDEGGPQASGGGFRGAGYISGLGNIANMLAGNESERVGYYDEGGRFYEPPAAPVPSGVLGSGQNNNAVFPSYANMPMGEAGRGGVPMQAGRPNPQMGIPMPKAPLPAAPSYLMPSSMQMPMQQESSGSPAEQPTGQMRQAATGLTYAPPTSSAEVDFMKSELFKGGYIVDGYGDSDIKELYKLFVQ